MEPICTGKYVLSRIAEAESGGPSSGDGAGPLSILTCQILLGKALTEESRKARRTQRDKEWNIVMIYRFQSISA